MKIKMKTDVKAKADESGSMAMVYKAGTVYDMSAEWQMKMATKFMNNGKADKSVGAKSTKVITDVEKKTTSVKKTILKKVFGKKDKKK